MNKIPTTLLTIGYDEDLVNFKDCVYSQKEWAIWHDMDHKIIKVKKNKQHISWSFYEKFINFMLENPNEIVIAMMPSVMVLEFFNNPFQFQQDLILCNSGDIAIMVGRQDGGLVNSMHLQHSLKFKDVKNSSCDLGLHVLSTKIKNYVHFMAGLAGKPEYFTMYGGAHSHGYELHAKTYVDDRLGIKYNLITYNDHFYKGGDFAVNLNTSNYMLSQGLILEFNKMRFRIKELVKELHEFEKDIVKPNKYIYNSPTMDEHLEELKELERLAKLKAKAEQQKLVVKKTTKKTETKSKRLVKNT